MDELRLSVSKVKTFESCAKKFQYTYVLKLPRKEHDFFSFGKFCHTALENFHIAYLNGSTDTYDQTMTKVFKDAKQEYGPKMKPEMIKECFEILSNYLKIISTNKMHNLSVPIIAVEKNFTVKLNDQISLIGMIDRLQVDNDGVLHVADYKTTKNKKYLMDDFFQLLTYGFVLMQEDSSIEKIRASYILLRHNFELITQEFDRDTILEVRDKYIDYANKIINETEYSANPTRLCEWCDFIDICDQGKKQLKRVNGEIEW